LHIFAGFLGTAVTPATMLILQQSLGWQGAFLAASVMGLLVAIPFLAAAGRAVRAAAEAGAPAERAAEGRQGRLVAAAVRGRSCSISCSS
jgi:hypothetical protein